MEVIGSLRVTNPKTLRKYKESGIFQKILDEEYIYATGCGRFRKEICTCHKCKRAKHA